MTKDKLAPYRKAARDTIDPEARTAILELIGMVNEANDRYDTLNERVDHAIAVLKDKPLNDG